MAKLHHLRLTTLELLAQPEQTVLPPALHLHIMENRNPEPSFYQFLYTEIGKDVGWVDRLDMDPDSLHYLLKKPSNRLHVLYVDGNPGGLAELEFYQDNEVQIAHFGLIPSLRGQKLGQFFFNWVLHNTWTDNTDRMWLSYTEWDHPAAVRIFQKAGFTMHQEDVVQKYIPDTFTRPLWKEA